MKQTNENFQTINIEINNYQTFRKGLIEFLKLNHAISYHDFIKEIKKIYTENECSFDINNTTFSNFSNLYYN